MYSVKLEAVFIDVLNKIPEDAIVEETISKEEEGPNVQHSDSGKKIKIHKKQNSYSKSSAANQPDQNNKIQNSKLVTSSSSPIPRSPKQDIPKIPPSSDNSSQDLDTPTEYPATVLEETIFHIKELKQAAHRARYRE